MLAHLLNPWLPPSSCIWATICQKRRSFQQSELTWSQPNIGLHLTSIKVRLPLNSHNHDCLRLSSSPCSLWVVKVISVANDWHCSLLSRVRSLFVTLPLCIRDLKNIFTCSFTGEICVEFWILFTRGFSLLTDLGHPLPSRLSTLPRLLGELGLSPASPRSPHSSQYRSHQQPRFFHFSLSSWFRVFSLSIWESSILGCSRTFQIGSILKQLLSRNQLKCQKFPYCLKMSRMLQMCQNSTTHKNMSHILNWKTPNYQNVQYVRSVL